MNIMEQLQRDLRYWKDTITRNASATNSREMTLHILKDILKLTDKEIEALETGELRVATKDQTCPPLHYSEPNEKIKHYAGIGAQDLMLKAGFVKCIPKG